LQEYDHNKKCIFVDYVIIKLILSYNGKTT
jgi:hypothetical protein